jgi:hypothetical protein
VGRSKLKGTLTPEKVCIISICGDALGLKYEPLALKKALGFIIKKISSRWICMPDNGTCHLSKLCEMLVFWDKGMWLKLGDGPFSLTFGIFTFYGCHSLSTKFCVM